MSNFLKSLVDTAGYMPHGHCYLWDRGLVALHLFSDLAIGVAYVVISLTLAYLVSRAKRDIPFSWIFVGFGLFIVACGATHFMEIWTLWTPAYWLSGAVKVVTAVASIAVAVVIPPLVPKTLALIRSAKLSDQRKTDLELANQALQGEIGERHRAEDEIQKLNNRLEESIRARTAELAASETAARMAAIVQHSNEAIVSLSLDNCITSWNPAAERMYGYRSEEVLGHSASMLAPVSLSNETPKLIDRLGRGEDIKSFETTRLRKSGEPILVYLTLSPIKDEAGVLQGASALEHDRNERKRGEEMLRLTVDASPSPMVMVDGVGQIVLVNTLTEKLFGYRREELIGQPVEILVPRQYRGKHPGDRSGFMHSPGNRAMGAGRALYALRKDGTEFPVEIGLNPIKTDQGTWVLSAIVDITEHKLAERRVLERAAELTAVNAELEAFSYSVSHDLRAPLRQIAGFSKILAEESDLELRPESRRYLQRVQDGAQQMGNLIDDLLNLAKVGRHIVARRSTPVKDLIAMAIEELKPDTLGRTIEWRIEAMASVECDPGLAKQIFVNLLSNALKYTRIRSHALIQIGQMGLNGESVIFVRDNGAGFDMQYAGKLFGVFQRLHKATDFEGTGVGLATVQRIVHKHGGRIWAEAELDKGATFYFTIPNGPTLEPTSIEDFEKQEGKQ
jgi:PAS domain S-box-containing protein